MPLEPYFYSPSISSAFQYTLLGPFKELITFSALSLSFDGVGLASQARLHE